MDLLPALTITPKSGQEPFTNNGQSLPLTLLNFWQWSSSDLVNNALRGVLAEFIVASALGCQTPTRTEWDAYDLQTAEGLKIEVKSAAYLQSWAQKKLSTIQFNIRPTHSWDDETESRSLTKARQADVYIFCVLHHTDKTTVNPLNLDQWRFYLLPAESLNKAAGEQQSISLSALQKLNPTEATFSEIKSALHTLCASA